jgi:pSer/pThr/pTyr-binding forkhead associated (FHA) protein
VGNTLKFAWTVERPPAQADTDIDSRATMPLGPKPMAKSAGESAPPALLRLRLPDRRRYPLSRELTIGRAPTNDVVVSDPSVSRYHCKIHIMADRAFVERVSDKPMRVNGVECDGGWLTEGSTIVIGCTEMWVVSAGSPSSLRVRR